MWSCKRQRVCACVHGVLDCAGFEVFFVEDASRGIAAESIAAEMEKMKAAGIKTVKSDDVA